MNKICSNCIFYTTDEDNKGNVVGFYHDRDKESGFCLVRDLFYLVKKKDKACENWESDEE